MVGLGEHPEEIVSVLQDIAAAGCDYVTIGQYLAPSEQHHPIIEFVTPEQFLEYERIARKMGLEAASGPLVRSSYHAKTMFQIT